MSKLIDCRGPHTLQCKQPPLPPRLRKTKESHLFIFEFERLEATGRGHLVLVLKRPSECWLVTVSGLVELRMLRLFPTMGLVDLVDDAVGASSLTRSFSQRPTLPRFVS
jgi:hypothetical protein